MKTFYKIDNGRAQIGSGGFIPDGFVEYKVGQEPQELKNALEAMAVSEELSVKLNEAKSYLASTDYVVTKIAEAQALGENTASMLTEYADVLAKRKSAREFIGANA